MQKISYMRYCRLIIIALLFVPLMGKASEKESLFSWSANATLTSNYLWRGLYCGGPSLQLDATVGYGGFYANVW